MAALPRHLSRALPSLGRRGVHSSRALLAEDGAGEAGKSPGGGEGAVEEAVKPQKARKFKTRQV